jgi:hypothetical protein
MVKQSDPPDLINQRHANGQPFAITYEQRDIMCKYLKQGMSFRQPAAMAGIRPVAAEEWMVKAGDPLRGSKYTRPDEDRVEPYISFAVAIRRAIAEAEQVAVRSIRRDMSDDWKAAAWWLEHHRGTSDEWQKLEAEKEGETGEKPLVQIIIPSNGRELGNMSNEHAKVEFVEEGEK